MVRKHCLILGFLSLILSCSPAGGGLELLSLPDQVVEVNQELVINLETSILPVAELTYLFQSSAPNVVAGGKIRTLPSGFGQFSWIPTVEDIGIWRIEFSVWNEQQLDSLSIIVEVTSGTSLSSTPRFIKPQGDGTFIDLAVDPCIEVELELGGTIEERVTISEEAPAVSGATLTQTSNATAIWDWCPTKRQIDASDRYTIVFGADDGRNPKITREYQIVLKKNEEECSGGNPPTVTHSPLNQTTLEPITITASIQDDVRLKSEPLLYYSATEPSPVPDLSTMTQVSMRLSTGNTTRGTWQAAIPNPVTGLLPGESAELYYVIEASDENDVDACVNRVVDPSSGFHTITVLRPVEADTGAGLCEACTADVQCGESSDLCVALGGSATDGFCLSGCSSDGDCIDGYECSPRQVASIDGVFSRQCIPLGGECEGATPTTCQDDELEENDSFTEVLLAAPLSEGNLDLVSCSEPGLNGSDEDWFKLTVGQNSNVELNLTGSAITDLDLVLYFDDGTPVTASASSTSVESIVECLSPGDYFIQVIPFGLGRNEYALSFTETPTTSCSLGGGGICLDDANENDDDLINARVVSTTPFVSIDQSICEGDDDWYEVWLSLGDRFTVELTFVQNSFDEDLDLHFFDWTNTDLTPCSVEDPSNCSVLNGQSIDSNEFFEGIALVSGFYYVVVRGFDGAENTYDIAIDVF